MKCAKCGQETAEWQKFCPNCGAPVSQAKNWPWIGVLILLVLLGGLLAYRIYTVSCPKQQAGVPAEAPPPPAVTAESAPPAAAEPPRREPERSKSPARIGSPPVTAPPRKPERAAGVKQPLAATPSTPAPRVVPEPEPAPPPAAAEAPSPQPARPPRPRAEIFRPEPPEVGPPASPPPATAPAYQGPSAGTLIWSGQIEKDTLVRINGNQVSIGRLTGELPGVPVNIEFETDAFAIVEPPGPANNWKRLYLRSLKRIRSGVVIKWSLR